MKTIGKEAGKPRPSQGAVPGAAKTINTAIAAVLSGLSIYHYTQPNEAWRSGTMEIASAGLLLLAAYRLSRIKAMVVNLVIALAVTGLGIRHLIHGGGWMSGTAELFFAVLLLVVASMIYRNKKD
jgi:predicted small integral membrane protein